MRFKSRTDLGVFEPFSAVFEVLVVEQDASFPRVVRPAFSWSFTWDVEKDNLVVGHVGIAVRGKKLLVALHSMSQWITELKRIWARAM